MIKKLIWIIVLLTTLFILFVFLFPSTSDSAWNKFWFKNININLRNIKSTFDKIMTRIPTKEEVKDAKEDIDNIIKSWKNKIDTIRKTLSWAEDKIKDAKEFIDDTAWKINKIKKTIDNVKDIRDNINNLTWTWIN